MPRSASFGNIQNPWFPAPAYSTSLGIPGSQETYRPHTQSDRRFGVRLGLLMALHSQGQHGIPLRDRDDLTSRYVGPVGPDDPTFRERGPVVSIRLQVWPPTTSSRTPIQRASQIPTSTPAECIARAVERFIEVVIPYDPPSSLTHCHFSCRRSPGL